MGADVRPRATTRWSGACRGSRGRPVRATDVRAGAALVLAGLVAEGETEVTGRRAHRPRLRGPGRDRCAPSAPTWTRA